MTAQPIDRPITPAAAGLAEVMRQAADGWFGKLGSVERDDNGKRDAYVVMAEAALDAALSDRFMKLVIRIANWTDAELLHVSPAQVRHIAQLVVRGADPIYPPFPARAADEIAR